MSEKDITLGFLLQASDEEVEAYKHYIGLPPAVAAHPFYSASNRVDWVKLDKYALFLRDTSGTKTKDAYAFNLRVKALSLTPSAPLQLNPSKRPSPEVIEISDDDSDSAVPAPPPKKRTRHIPLVFKYNKAERICITQKEHVARVVELDHIPTRWPCEEDVAYVIDVSHSKSAVATGTTYRGRPKGLDALLKAEDQDSWGGGTNGSAVRETKLTILDDLPSRRSTHLCNGGLHCQFFDVTLLDGYQRIDDDMSLMQEIFALDLEQNKKDSSTTLAVTARRAACKKKGCTGHPVLKSLRNGPSNDGKLKFIGCSHWRPDEEFDHLYIAIPLGVDEKFIGKYMAGLSIASASTNEYDTESCAHFIHPRHGMQKDCPHTHFQDNELVVGKMTRYACPVQKIVYTSKDPNVKMLVVIFRGRHSHPPWPMEKPGQEAKDDLAKCLNTIGSFGVTGGKLNKSTTTRALLGSDLSVKHPAYRDARRLRDAVLTARSASTPAGLLWAGILEQFQQDLALPISQQYIHVVRMEADLKLAVCLDPDLARLIHEVRYLVTDFTFKRLFGDLNEWEVAVWLDGNHERVTAARIYCNRATKQAFTYIFDGFFMAVEKVTGQPVRFKAFDPKGNIISIHFDMEAAQVQGFALALLKLIKGLHPEQDPDVIVQYVVKLCSVHFTRSTDPLVAAVGQETVDYLNRIRGLKSAADIDAWHSFCRNHDNKKLRGLAIWIGKALSLAAARETCISVNRNNSDHARMQRSTTRSARRAVTRTHHSELENSIKDTAKELDDVSTRKSTLAQRLKDLKTEKKTLGRAPRNSHSVDRFGTAGSIPRVSSSSVATEDEQDSEVEVVDPEILPTSSLVLRASSPAPSSSSGFNEVNMSDYFSDSMQSRPASAPPSSSSGFDLASRAFDFDTDDADAYSDDGAGAYSDDAGAYPLAGDYDRGVEAGDHVDGFLLTGSDFLGVPGFDFNEFLDACGDAPYVNAVLGTDSTYTL
ncbi:hypothetical protein B0H13DRAFT_2477555 [Mycena leptocephala]|nr:hypothetical protein B0H13DRAFT_2477555 [Mycena leptocephala]